jgi:hypothetical protein
LRKDEIGAVCHLLLESILEPKSAAYVAGPLDTGKLYYEFLVKGEPPRGEIRKVNEKKLTDFACRLRRVVAIPVVDPGRLRIPQWQAADYGQLFLRIIDVFVREVWFINGWEYSTGATKEFAYCVRKGITCTDEAGKAINIAEGRERIQEAIRYVESFSLNADKLRAHLP